MAVSELTLKLERWTQGRETLDEVKTTLISCLEVQGARRAALDVLHQVVSHVPTSDFADSFLRPLLPVMLQMFTSIVEEIKQLLESESTGTVEEVGQRLEDCSALVSVVENSLEKVELQGPDLLQGLSAVLLSAFQHCKESPDLYGHTLQSLVGPLRTLFSQAHDAQVRYISLVTREQPGLDQVVEKVLQGLSKAGQLLATLDMKATSEQWKAFLLLSEQYCDMLKGCGIVEQAVACLAMRCRDSLRDLWAQESPDDHQARKALKVIAFYLKVVLKLCSLFSGSLEGSVHQELGSLLVSLHRFSMPCLPFAGRPPNLIDESATLLTVDTQLLVGVVVNSAEFSQCFLKQAKHLDSKDQLGAVLLITYMASRLQAADHYLLALWLGDSANNNLLYILFDLIQQCGSELSSTYHLPAPMRGEAPREGDLYEHILTHTAGLMVVVAKLDPVGMEAALLHALQGGAWGMLLALDLWVLLDKYNGCEWRTCRLKALLSHLATLTSLTPSPVTVGLSTLSCRLLASIPEATRAQLAQDVADPRVWSQVGLHHLPEGRRQELALQLVARASDDAAAWLTGPASTVLLQDLVASLQALPPAELLPVDSSVFSLADSVKALWHRVPPPHVVPPSAGFWLSRLVSALCHASASISGVLSGPDMALIARKLNSAVRSPAVFHTCMRVAALRLLECWGSQVLPSDMRAPFTSLLNSLVQDSHPLVRQAALETVSHLAHGALGSSDILNRVLTSSAFQNLAVPSMQGQMTDFGTHTHERFLRSQMYADPGHRCEDPGCAPPMSQIDTAPTEEGHPETVLQQKALLAVLKRMQHDAQTLQQLCGQLEVQPVVAEKAEEVCASLTMFSSVIHEQL